MVEISLDLILRETISPRLLAPVAVLFVIPEFDVIRDALLQRYVHIMRKERLTDS